MYTGFTQRKSIERKDRKMGVRKTEIITQNALNCHEK